MGCRGCAWGAGDARGDPWFLFNSFISELEAGARGMVMNGADGAPPGGVGNDGSVCDAERLGEARWGDAQLASKRPGTEMATGKAGNQTARETRGRGCSAGWEAAFTVHTLQNPPLASSSTGGGCVRPCHFVALAARSFRISAKS